jgi:hypothetical protein
LKPQDLFILYQTLVCKSQNLPLQSNAVSMKNWTELEIKASQRRLQHLGLLDSKYFMPNFDRVRIFLIEALSFWWPAGKTKFGLGLPLALSGCGKVLSSSSHTVPYFLWPCADEMTEGEIIEPLWEDLPQAACEDRELHEFFSLVEVLRFYEHPIKNWAQKQMSSYLEKIQKLGVQNYPDIEQDFLELKEAEFENLVSFICQNGFKALTLQKAALITQLPAHYLIERWETDHSLRLWIAGKYQEKAYQFLGPLLGQIHEMNKGHLAMVLESFLNFVESHEDYYKMNLWAYLENDPSIQEMSRRGTKSFFETVLTLFKKSKPEAVHKAEFYSYLFSTMWKMYASFIWCESKSLNPVINVPRLKIELKNFILRSVFEEY